MRCIVTLKKSGDNINYDINILRVVYGLIWYDYNMYHADLRGKHDWERETHQCGSYCNPAGMLVKFAVSDCGDTNMEIIFLYIPV